MDIIAKFLEDHWTTISAAPWVFVHFALLLIVATWGAAAVWYRREIAHLNRQLARANELAEAKPSFGSQFSKLTNLEMRESALQLVGAARGWKIEVEKRNRIASDKRDVERSEAAQARDDERMKALFHSHGAISRHETQQMIEDFRARFKVRFESHYEELLIRMPGAKPSPNHHFQHVMNPYDIDRMVDALEKLAMQLQ